MKRPLSADDGELLPSVDAIHPSRKRRVEYSSEDARLAKLYSDLADEVKSVRLRAAADLVRLLKTTETHALDRALTRLIRGLCSGRKAARSGFFVALTEVLSVTVGPHVKAASDVDFGIPALIDRIHSITQPDASGSNQVRPICSLHMRCC